MHRLPQVVEFFASLGIPAPALNAYFITGLELFRWYLLGLGLGSRFITLLLAGDMIVAYITADREALLSIFSRSRQSSMPQPIHVPVCHLNSAHLRSGGAVVASTETPSESSRGVIISRH